jgi:hypothetical protein
MRSHGGGKALIRNELISRFCSNPFWRTIMLNAVHLSERDLSTIDIKTLSPAGWEAYKREVVRRAHAGRSKFILDLIGRAIRGGRPVRPLGTTVRRQLAFSFDETR